MTRQKTADERSQERYDAERRALELFLPKLQALASWLAFGGLGPFQSFGPQAVVGLS